jgi:hypothetical protein
VGQSQGRSYGDPVQPCYLALNHFHRPLPPFIEWHQDNGGGSPTGHQNNNPATTRDTGGREAWFQGWEK